MTDIISCLNHLNWDYEDELSGKVVPMTSGDIRDDPSVIQNNQDTIGMYIEKDKPENSRALEYTRNDEDFKKLLDTLFDEEVLEDEDDQEGDDFVDLIMKSNLAEFQHQNRYEISNIEGRGNQGRFSQAYQDFSMDDLIDPKETDFNLRF